jgi:rhodanese-related sulfurtransferase
MEKVVAIIAFCFVFGGGIAQQQVRLVDCPIELAEHVSLWDKLIGEKLKELYPDKEMLEHCSSITFERAIRDAGAQLVDVRTEAEYNEDHIAGAILIDIRKDDFIQQVDKLLTMNKPVTVYCRGGVRSRKASEMLLSKGFQVFNLDRGFAQWKKDGKPVVVSD